MNELESKAHTLLKTAAAWEKAAAAWEKIAPKVYLEVQDVLGTYRAWRDSGHTEDHELFELAVRNLARTLDECPAIEEGV